MEEIELILTNQVPSGVYLLESKTPAQAIQALVEARDWCFLYLDGMHIFKVEQFYTEFGLKDKSGANANQLWDVFGDLEMWFSERELSGSLVNISCFEAMLIALRS